MEDRTLLAVIVILLFVSSVLRVRLADKKGRPLSFGWRVQTFVFPVMLLLALALFMAGTDVVFQLVMLGLLEELVCWAVRRKQRK